MQDVSAVRHVSRDRKVPNFVRYFYLLLSAIIVSSCSQSQGLLPLSGSAENPNGPLAGGIRIAKVSSIKAKQHQTIDISGRGFGTMKPYNGDSAYLEIVDTTGGWSAGYTDDPVWLNVTSWSNNKIVIAGFTGDYGKSGWILKKGDNLEISVWNAQHGNGPATRRATVK